MNVDVKSIESTITAFAETSAVLMKGLDALGQLHPFVGVAVMAFKLVITLDITRRQNNKKILAVKIQMQDLMTILFQLRHMRDPEEKGPDGTTLKDRMSGLMESIAKHITACGSACDVYLKKSFLGEYLSLVHSAPTLTLAPQAKTIKSKIYEARLAGYVTNFANDKKDIGFALKVHTALGVDAANKKLDGQDEHLKNIEGKIEALFRKLDTPRECEVKKFIDDKGGAKACVDNEETLQELVLKSGERIADMDPTHSGNGDLVSARKMLNRELAEDVDDAFQRNMKLFDRKMEMQSRQMADAISITGEHIISVLSGGSHEKIVDADLQAIWKEQGWKGSVKARHFVLALNDYYTEKFTVIDTAVAIAESNAGSAPPSPLMSPTSPALADPDLPAGAKPEDDRWALAYINVAHLQPILEAVDDDGTGFVSIKEANEFALSRPKGWSLLSWVAFWAAGWHASVTWHKNRIYNLLAAMMLLIQRVKAGNIQAADTYFAGPAMLRVELLLRSTRSAPGNVYDDARLAHMTRVFQDMEEKRLLAQLEGLAYELDDTATLRLITGPRRIERYVFPLIFRVIKHHYDIMRLACVHILHETEFEIMSGSLATIFKAVDERTGNLEAIFKATSMNVKEHLGHFAFGMFQLAYGGHERDPKNNTLYNFEEEDGFETDEDEDLGPGEDDDEETVKAILARMDLSILHHTPENEPSGVYDFETVHPPPATRADPLDGPWTGQLLCDGESYDEGTISMMLVREGDQLTGGAESWMGLLDVSGTVAEEHQVVITIVWPDGYGAVCTGRYDPETDTIAGICEDKEDDDDSSSSFEEVYTFIFRRTPPAVYRFRYTDAEFTKNPARARWGFAIAATIDQVKQRHFSWSYLKNRFAERRNFIKLTKAQTIVERKLTPWTPLSDSDLEELQTLKDTLHPSDSRFYNSVVVFELQKVVAYARKCASCERRITDVRLFCIQCMDDRGCDCIDLCSECIDQTVEKNTFVHVRAHLLVKTFRRIQDGDLAWTIPEARRVAARAKKAFADATSLLTRLGDKKGAGHSKKRKAAVKYCVCCAKPVSPPCWLCVDCVDETYICVDCDTKRAKPLPDNEDWHALSHALVEIYNSEPIVESLSTDSKLAELESQVLSLDSRMAALEEKLETRFTSLEAVLNRIEDKLVGPSKS
ncbi:hypothetical protein C8R46DRAFT_904554 [Mycena filopes]|nr:hypothetical protein C8R46DRAFT_904554 [Mycena filopes]